MSPRVGPEGIVDGPNTMRLRSELNERGAGPRSVGNFYAILQTVEDRFSQLVSATPRRIGEYLSRLPKGAGVYLITNPKSKEHYYVGRTRKIQTRLTQHAPGGDIRQYPRGASLAISMTREKTCRKPTYRKEGGLSYLFENDPDWRSKFRESVSEIRAMDVRCVLESEPKRQHLLELYAQIELDPRYNRHETT